MLRPRRILPLLCLLLLLAGCKPSAETGVIAIVGAVLLDGTGAPPASDSVVTVEGSRIRAVGSRGNLPVPADADKIDGTGLFLVPGLIDVAARLDNPASLNGYLQRGVTSLRASVAGDWLALRSAQRQGPPSTSRLFLTGRSANLDALEFQDAPDILDEARRSHLPIVADVRTLADARRLVNAGATEFRHMIRDTTAIEAAFVSQLRDLQVVFIPMLATTAAAEMEAAKSNTRRLAAGGVPIAVGSNGDTQHEFDLLVEAGLSPAEVLAAATRNGALALGYLDQLGTIEPGKRADLLLISANPVEDIRNLRKIDRVMLDGRWVYGNQR